MAVCITVTLSGVQGRDRCQARAIDQVNDSVVLGGFDVPVDSCLTAPDPAHVGIIPLAQVRGRCSGVVQQEADG